MTTYSYNPKIETVKELREFLADFEDDDLILVMVHDAVLGTPLKQYRGYYPLAAKDDEGNPVLLVNKQKSYHERMAENKEKS